MSDSLVYESVWNLSDARSSLFARSRQLFQQLLGVRETTAALPVNHATAGFQVDLETNYPGLVRAVLRAPAGPTDFEGKRLRVDRIQVTGDFFPVNAYPIRLWVDRFEPTPDGSGATVVFQKFMRMRGEFEITVRLVSGKETTGFVVRKSYEPDPAVA